MVHAARDDSRPVVFLSDEPVPGYRDIPIISHADLQDDDEICLAGRFRRNPSPARRKRFADFAFATIVAPTAVIDPTAEIGEGARDLRLLPGEFARSESACHFQCNSRSHVHHDSLIGDYVTFSPGTMCLGTVEIGNDVFVGAGAISAQWSCRPAAAYRRWCNCWHGRGRDQRRPAGATVVGCPARRLVR
jgi:hypothetical protein